MSAMCRRLLRDCVVVLVTVLAFGARGQTFEAADAPLNLKGATGQTAEWLRAFAGEPERFSYTVEPAPQEKDLPADAAGFRLYRVTFPSPMKTPYAENNTVPAELYLPIGA